MAVKHSELQKKYEALQKPLEDHEVEWKIGVVINKDQKTKRPQYPSKVMLMPYVKHDVVQRRLNTILGFGNWSFEIERFETKGTKSRLTIHTDERDVVFEDLADDADSGGIKGSATRALPRVVRLLGMADELYRLPKVWVMAQSEYNFETPPPLDLLQKQANIGIYDVTRDQHEAQLEHIVAVAAQSQRPVEPAPPANVKPIRNTNGYLFAAIGAWNDFHEYTGDDKENKRKDFATAKGFHVKSFADLTDPQRIELALLFKQDLVLQMARKRPGDFSLDKEAELVKWASNARADAKLIGDLTALECDKILAAWDDAKQETA